MSREVVVILAAEAGPAAKVANGALPRLHEILAAFGGSLEPILHRVDAAGALTDAEKSLARSYWIQVDEDRADELARRLNALLNDDAHPGEGPGERLERAMLHAHRGNPAALWGACTGAAQPARRGSSATLGAV